MSIRGQMVKNEEPEIYQTNRQEPTNSDSTSTYSEPLAQIVEKMNDLATEQYSVTKKFTLIEAALEKALQEQKVITEKASQEREQTAQQHDNTLGRVADTMKSLRTEVIKNQQDQINLVKTTLQAMNKEQAEQTLRTKELRQELIEFVVKFKQEQK